jgi:hypothetical protein
LTPRRAQLPAHRIWLRIAQPNWADPVDPSFAQETGGRWNPPRSSPALYLNADVQTARGQIERLCAGTPVTPDDLDDHAYVLVGATLPGTQEVADGVHDEGLAALSLPATYPLNARGATMPHADCQPIGAALHRAGLRGIWCRSATTPDGRGRELAWFSGKQRARAIPGLRLPYGKWRHARSWQGIGLRDQPDPVPVE